MSLTQKQQQIIDFIRQSIINDWSTPTIREIGEDMGIASPNGVMQHLAALEKKGVITRDRKQARKIKLVGYRLELKAVE